MRPHQLLLGDVERAALLQHVIRDADLADVVEQEAVLHARIVEQRRLDRLRQLDRVALDPLRVRRGAEILRLERAGERSHRLAVRPLQELPATALDLEQTAQIVRVQQQLLVRFRRHAGAERAVVEPAGEVLDDVQQLERAERLAEEHIRTRLPGRLLGHPVGAGEQDDPDPARRGIFLQPPAERDAVFAGQPDVEHDDVGRACGDRRRRLRRGPGFVDLDVDQLERRPQERQQPRIVVDEEDARRAGVDPWKQGGRLPRSGSRAATRPDLHAAHRRAAEGPAGGRARTTSSAIAVPCGILGQVAGRACVPGALNVLHRRRGREHHHPDPGEKVSDGTSCRDPVDTRHVDVHQDDVRPQPCREGDGLGTRRGAADDLDPVVEREQQLQGLGVELVVVGEQDSDGLRSAGGPDGSARAAPFVSCGGCKEVPRERAKLAHSWRIPRSRECRKRAFWALIRLSACGSASLHRAVAAKGDAWQQ